MANHKNDAPRRTSRFADGKGTTVDDSLPTVYSLRVAGDHVEGTLIERALTTVKGKDRPYAVIKGPGILSASRRDSDGERIHDDRDIGEGEIVRVWLATRADRKACLALEKSKGNPVYARIERTPAEQKLEGGRTLVDYAVTT